MLDFMPIQASEWAAKVDWLNNVITWISVFCIVVITGVMVFFAVKYRRREGDGDGPYIVDDHLLETVWTVVPTIICMAIFAYGYIVYKDMRNYPANALEINVTGSKWRWDFQYTNGKKTTSEVVVPVGRAVRFIMTSKDVLHSFFVPSMRVKEDVVPGTYQYLWFSPTKTGEFPIFCAEYCGLQHSGMLATLRVVSPEEFEDYLNDRTEGEKPQLSPIELGKLTFSPKGKACTQCHSIDGTKILGPSLKGLFGREVELQDGTKLTADENYFRESVMNPKAKIVAGYPPVMPSFEGQLSEEEIAGLIAYIKSL